MSTSKLQVYTGQQLRRRFSKYGIVENIRPVWLVSSKGERLELDFYLERLSIVVEVQGRQHFKFTPVFHNTEWDFQEQLRRDREKLEICQRAGIDLLYVCKKSDIEIVLTACYDALKNSLDSEDVQWITQRPEWLDSLSKKHKFIPKHKRIYTPSRPKNEPRRTLIAMLTYSRMIQRHQNFKPKQLKKAAMLHSNMWKMLESNYKPTKKEKIGFRRLGRFLRARGIIA